MQKLADRHGSEYTAEVAPGTGADQLVPFQVMKYPKSSAAAQKLADVHDNDSTLPSGSLMVAVADQLVPFQVGVATWLPCWLPSAMQKVVLGQDTATRTFEASGVVLLAAGTTAGAAIAGPIDGSGVIHGCYCKPNTAGSSQVVLQDTSTTCPRNTTPITWNQTGPQGPQGDTGPSGTSQVYTTVQTYCPCLGIPKIAPSGSNRQSVASLSLPAGNYLAEATLTLENRADFAAADNSRMISCQISPAPDFAAVPVNGADTNSANDTLSINVALSVGNPFTASLDCVSFTSGTDESHVFVRSVRLTAVAVDNIQSQ